MHFNTHTVTVDDTSVDLYTILNMSREQAVVLALLASNQPVRDDQFEIAVQIRNSLQGMVGINMTPADPDAPPVLDLSAPVDTTSTTTDATTTTTDTAAPAADAGTTGTGDSVTTPVDPAV